MQLILRSQFSKVFAKILCLLVVSAYAGVAVCAMLASRLESSDELQAIKRAIALDPWNAKYRDDLGQYYMFREQRPDLAIPPYQSTVKMNAHVADYWLDLASAYSATGAGDQQKFALERALQVDPNTPIVLRQVANAFFARGDVHQAAGMYRHLLQNDRWETESTLQICWQGTHDLDVMSEVLPTVPRVHLVFLKMLIGEGRTEEAELMWPRLVALQLPFEPALAESYIDYLIAQRDVKHARGAWEDLGGMDPHFRPYLSSAGNLVVNGGFEEKIINMGFDWRYVVEPHAVLAVDTQQFHGGSRSLSVTFDGEAVVDTGLSQFIAVEANRRYAFTAYARADDISAAQGPQFVISDAFTKDPLLQTEEILGASGWRQLSGSFQTGPNTNLVSLRIMRSPGAGRITGKLWIDDVAMLRQ
jgi:hypothetical protein